MKILLDTCAIIWTIAEPDRLSPAAQRAITDPTAQLAVSAISCAEIACAVDRGRLELDQHWKPWFRHFVALNSWSVRAIDLEIVEESYSLPPPFHRDPADRLIVATARLDRQVIVTADRRILGYPHVESIW